MNWLRFYLPFLCSLAFTAWPLSSFAQQSPSHAGVVFATTPQRDLTLDVYLPRGVPNSPLVVYIHGGGWRSGNPKQVPFAYLTKEGFAVASISYRFSHEAKFPAQLEDVRAALAWLKSNASHLGVDASRVALIGGSAGAHLAMLAGLTTDANTAMVRAIVSYFGPTDFLLRARTQPKSLAPGSTVYDLLGGSAMEKETLAREASPAFHVTSSAPPLLLFHGTGDTTVLPDQAERMAEAYRVAGRPVEIHLKEGAGHKISDFQDDANRTLLLSFLQNHLSSQESSLTLAPVFTDHAVLQCEKPVAIWGTARPQTTVEVSLAGASQSTQTAADGRWRVTLPALPPGGPHQLLVRSGDEQISRSDILLGEVWLCGGQSNMNWGLIATDGGEDELAQLAAHPTNRVRLLRIPQTPADTPQTRLEAAWTPCTPETARDFSSIGFRFGRALETALDRPVGLIHANWGGTPAEAWLPREVLEANPWFADAFDRHAKKLASAPEPRPEGLERGQPAASWNGIIAPLVPFTLRGVLWYQGEANVGRPHHYAALFRTLIETWRDRFRDPSLPFLFVQLPRYAAPKTPCAWAELRAAQESALALPHTAMAVAIDTGDPEHIHPRDKAAIADRLARLALAKVYEKRDIPADAPRITGVRFADRQAIATLAHADGLKTTDGQPPKAFELAGADGIFHSAVAGIGPGATITLTSPHVPAPTALRYAWANAPEVNIINADGLPLAPYNSAFHLESHPTNLGPEPIHPSN